MSRSKRSSGEGSQWRTRRGTSSYSSPRGPQADSLLPLTHRLRRACMRAEWASRAVRCAYTLWIIASDEYSSTCAMSRGFMPYPRNGTRWAGGHVGGQSLVARPVGRCGAGEPSTRWGTRQTIARQRPFVSEFLTRDTSGDEMPDLLAAGPAHPQEPVGAPA
jgi:hypothetical protein